MATPLRLLTLALLIGSTLGLTNCKKNSVPEPDNRSQREIWLTTPGWSMQSIKDVQTTPAGVVTTSTSPPAAFFAPCQLDDLYHFNTDRTFTVDDGPLKCQPPATPSTTTWSFAANETQIVYNASTKGSEITTLTATTLALAYRDTAANGTTFVQTVTYVSR